MKSFSEYDQSNPHIWILFKSIALGYIHEGRKHGSAKLIIEEIRWHYFTKSKDYIKVTNNFTSMYARKFLLEYPQHAGFFKLKNLRSRPNVLPY